MALREEMTELLSGFEKRMKFINIVRYLLDYKYPDAIKAMIPEKKILDNLIVGVLVYIKERTLGGNQKCTLADVERFLEDFSVVLPCEYTIDTKILSRYIIVDVLQNGGLLTEYLTYFSGKEAFAMMPVRLLNEEKGSYHLTDDAFDFLFRSKEIESELDYSVTRFRMKEYMKRDNYVQALEQSRELVGRIRNMKTSMEDFLLRCRENISRISVDEYDSVITRIRALLENEYNELTDIQKNAKERSGKLQQAVQSGVESEAIKKRFISLNEIISNISLTVEEQRSLINQKYTLADSYYNLLRESYVMPSFERMSFEKEIMIPLRHLNDSLGDAVKFLLFPLTKPDLESIFSIESFYAPQSKINELSENDALDITETEETTEDIIAARNERFRQICHEFFGFAKDKKSFSISEFIESLRVSELVEYCKENALPNVILTMYSMLELDIAGWKLSEDVVVSPMGEFELAWCLSEIPKDYLDIQKIKFSNSNRTFGFEIKKESQSRKVDITDFDVEVIR